MFPPVNTCVNITDEDSGEENVVQLDNLPESQLRAPLMTFHQITIYYCRISSRIKQDIVAAEIL